MAVDRFDDDGPTARYVIGRLSGFIAPHWRGLVLSMLMLVALAALELLKPWPLKFIVDGVLGESELKGTTLYLLIGVTSAVVALAAFEGLIGYKQTEFVNRAGRTIIFDLRAALFSHVQRLSLEYHNRKRSGDLITRVTSDVKALKEVLVDSIVEIVYSAFFLVGMVVVLLWLDWQLALMAMFAGPPLYLLLLRYTRQIKMLSRREREYEGALASVLHESLAAVRLTRAYNREELTRGQFEEESAGSLELGLEATMAGARFSWITDIVRAAILALVLGFGAQRVMADSMTVGDLLVFLSYVQSFYKPIQRTMKHVTKVTKAMARAERVVEVLDTREFVEDRPDARPAPAFAGRVEFDNVTFAYGEGPPVLEGIDLVIPEGRVTALVGPTGAGKTTLASLIPRLYDPSRGSVAIDGTDVRNYTLASLRAQISLVLQESLLLRASIADNIAFGRPGADLDDIVAAAKAANAHEFVSALADGYNTEVGERGETLSGGQRQRIAIARAMIRDAPILILDEPLTGLDDESGVAVLEALERLMVGRTVIVITHQMSTVERADYVCVLEHGRLVEEHRQNGAGRRAIASTVEIPAFPVRAKQ
ncbi:MAG: ABC transporter ATP-binding protein [Dehalococcoidia bacterium]